MQEQEGVIKYQLSHSQQAVAWPMPLTEMNAWRAVMFRLQLIGQDPARYDNLGFGNISQRVPGGQQFIVSGTQTGHLAWLDSDQFSWVVGADPRQNLLESKGSIKPSSEALTHASIYQHDPQIQAVIHVHSPEIWRHSHTLDLPHTTADVPYGTVAMALAVEQLLASGRLQETPVFTMLGHEDGVVAVGANHQQAAMVLIKFLAMALAIEQER
ncbi:MAG: class II aldolase/adducin family protein [Methylococcaceae bacterium]|nr:class II aldolase/adducin family protein [Methylococcaceae bacterium]